MVISEQLISQSDLKATKQKTKKEISELTRLKKKLDKAQSELEKINKKTLLAKQGVEREKQKQYAAEAKRSWISCDFPSYEESLEVTPSILPSDFEVLHGRQLYADLVQCLSSSTYKEILRSISDFFAVDRTAVCLIEHREITRLGKRCQVIYFRYAFSREFNDFLKHTCEAKYDGRLKSWNVNITDLNKELIGEFIGDYFDIVIDLATLRIFSNNKKSSLRLPLIREFGLLEQYKSISFDKVWQVVASSKHGFGLTDSDRIYINTGESFVPLSRGEEVITLLENILIRYSVAKGYMRYARISMRISTVLETGFGHDINARAMIAKFLEACSFYRSGQGNLIEVKCCTQSGIIEKNIEDIFPAER